MASGTSQLNKSFFYAFDGIRGYGNISFFTFFSEFNRTWKNGGHVEAGLMTSLFVAAVIGNVFILGFICKSKRSRTITNYFVCNLAIADILFALSAPFVAYVRITTEWRLGQTMCGFLNYEMFVCATVMIWTMTAISIDRYICINLGASKKRMKPYHVAIICVCIWIVASCAYLPVAIYFHVKEIQLRDEIISICTLLWPKSTVGYSTIFTCLLLIFGFVIPLSIIAVNYFRIFRKFWSSKRAVGSVSTTVNTWNKRSKRAKRIRDLRIVKTLVLLVVLFVIMWSPLFIVFGLIQHDVSTETNEMPSSALVWTLLIAYVNPFVNPFLYGFINAEMRRSLKSCCGHHKVSCEDSFINKSPGQDNVNETQEYDITTHM